MYLDYTPNLRVTPILRQAQDCEGQPLPLAPKSVHEHAMLTSDAAKSWLDKASTLREALPYMRRYAGRTVVIKFGGHAMVDPKLIASFAANIVLLQQVGMRPIIVHGGGPQINQRLDQMGLESRSVNGRRVTDAATMEVVEMVLSGSVNKGLVDALRQAGGRAIGLSGKDGGLIRARKITGPAGEDLGQVGEPERIDPTILGALETAKFIPVIAPIGYDLAGQTYNINADSAAGAIAASLGTRRFLLLTDVAGVLDSDKQLLADLSSGEVRELIASGVASGGMIPKLETCLAALESGVEATVIMDGRVEDGILLELFTDIGAGTLIHA